MGAPHRTRTVGRTAVVACWLLALAVAGRPVWLAVLLGILLAGAWAAPYLLATNRRAALAPVVPVVEPRSAGPAT